MGARLFSSALLALVFGLSAAEALAVPKQPQDPRTPLQQAREEAGAEGQPPLPRLQPLPAGLLRFSETELLATTGQPLTATVELDRAVRSGTLELTLPQRWVSRSGVSGLRYAKVPSRGRRSSRSGRTVSLSFADARAGDEAAYTLTDVGIPPGEYELPYRWTERGGESARGSVTVRFYAPTRESQDPEAHEWSRIVSPGFEANVTNDASTESETFITVVPGDRRRILVGANGGGGYNAWITNDGGQTFTKASMPAATDAPGEAGNEVSALCCDPMSAADAAGNVWYGGLSFSNGAGNPSRIVVNRIAPGETSFQAATTGLPVRTNGTQDKPMMAIDNSPSSPRYGRLYVAWDEPSPLGVNIVLSQCDTRPGGTLDAARCDNADNWSAPVSVTPGPSGYIYADVAAGPDGTVYVVWWDYVAHNAIRGDSCGPESNCASAGAWGTPQTIALLDDTDGAPVPFACPIVAQPGGRASTSPQVDVDRSGGPHHGRVYVTWSDLAPETEATRCDDNLPPAATHLAFDSFVASAAGTLPGGAEPSPAVATRLLSDGEGGGQAKSDDWFAWLAVDQTTGQAWADLYSTRDDPLRRTTNFYVRSVTPDGSGHALGALTKVSTAPSDYSTAVCCTFGNDYGDYTGIDATQGGVFPVWSDKRGGLDGEAFTFIEQEPLLVAGTPVVDDGAGDGDGVLEPGEAFSLAHPVRNDGNVTATGVTGTLAGFPDLAVTQAVSAYPDIAVGATEGNVTPYSGSVSGDLACGDDVTATLSVTTAQGSFPIAVSLPTGPDCSAPPAAPSLTTEPASPAADTTPIVRGSAPGGSVVKVYTGAACSGTPAATGSAEALASSGFELSVPVRSTTQIRATATLDSFTSPCSSPIEYVESTPVPADPTPVPPPAPSPVATATATATPPGDLFIELNASASSLQKALRAKGLKLAVLCPQEACTVAVAGVVTIPSARKGTKAKRVRTRSARRALRKGQRAGLTLKLSKSLARQISRALAGRRTRGKVKATITVVATDAAGNRATRTLRVRIRR